MKMTNPKKSILAGLTVGAMSWMLVIPQAQANIIGDIGFAGSYSLPGGENLGNATELIDIGAVVVSTIGAYTVIPNGTPATFASPLDINPSTPASPLWTVVSGGNTYTFVATTSTVTDQSGSHSHGYTLDMGGNGYAEINGLDKTFGTWLVTASESGMAIGFESTASVVGGVPDGGLTLGLLGSALFALQGLRRKLGC
jgi:hypothetical protein